MITIKRRNLIWLVPLALMITFPIWRIPAGKFLTPRGGYDPAYGNIDRDAHNFVMDKVIIIESSDGHITSKIRADVAKTSDVANEYLLEGVNADIFNENDEITNVVAEHGLFNNDSKLLTLTDNVVVHNLKSNNRLYSDLLYYDDKKQTVHCPGKTRMTGDTIEVNGSSFHYDVVQGRYDVGGRVLCIIQESIR